MSDQSQTSMENPQDRLDDIDAVSLMTYHAVKGLEFDKVILIGLEKNKNIRRNLILR